MDRAMTEALIARRPVRGLARLAALGVFAALIAGGLTAAYVPGTPLPAANILINPTAEIDQANEGSAVASSAGVLQSYVVDGFGVHLNSTATTKAAVSCQRASDAPIGYAYSLKCTVSTGASSVGNGDYLIVAIPIEADNIQDALLGTANAQTLCRQWQVKSSVAGYTYGWTFQNFAQTRSLPNVETVAGANTWTPFKSCFVGDTAGSWVTSGNAGGAYLIVAVAAGSTYQGTAGSWAGSNLYGTSALSNTILTTTGATFEITNAKLELSPVATPFQHASFASELARAQRYYAKSFPLGTRPAQNAGTTGALTAWSTCLASGTCGATGLFWQFPQTMRATPTLTTYDPSAADSGWADNGGHTGLTASIDPGGTAGTNGAFIKASAATTFGGAWNLIHATADARLALP
jgi:hypothetical protein